jgi:glucuronoarabinoxylan endo-1,4-beta-xylanase
MKIFKHAFIGFFFVISMMVFIRNEVLAATATVDTSEVHQTIEGFGASLAWEIWQLYTNPQREEIYDYLFKELGLDILRLRNIYGKGEEYAFPLLGEIVDSFYSLSENEPKIMISSWSPPASLKSNKSLTNGGTLDTTATGEYVYGDFAQYWVDALNAFEAVGIVPEYISIQNEPSYTATWESCRFSPTEPGTFAGYDQAFDSVYDRIQSLPSPPKMLAAEVHGIGYGTFQSFADEFNHDEYIYGHAYHLYHGGDGNVNPDAFNSNLIEIANNYSDKPIFQTEYDYGDWLNTVWLMHNCLVYGNVSGYFYWKSVWSSGTEPFITLVGGNTYTINKIYWAFRQYSKAIHHGWKRVGVNVVGASNWLRVSAYLSPEKDELSIVVLNLNFVSNDSVDIIVPGFDLSGANILRTTNAEECALVGYYDGSTLHLPAKSITTISTLEISSGSPGVEEENDNDLVGCFLAQNYPNPFSGTTTIRYSLNSPSFVRLTVFNTAGQRIRTLEDAFQSAGEYSVVWDARDDNNNPARSGVYLYRLEAGGKNIQKKMVLVR